jgi:hypothetical protein
MRWRPKLPSPAMGVALITFFLGVGSAGYAATGGTFMLGNPNSATSQTALTANNAGKALNITQQSTGAGATALGLNVPAGKAPFTVNSGTKVANLNADKLDGKDAAAFLGATGKAADAEKLDGLDSENFVQGTAARTMYVRRTVAYGQSVTLLTLPNFVQLSAHCSNPTTGQAAFGITNLFPTFPLDLGSTHDGTFSHTVNSLTAFPLMSTGWLADTIQVGQSYRLLETGPFRTRMVTFFLSGENGGTGSPCVFQAQALAQGY